MQHDVCVKKPWFEFAGYKGASVVKPNCLACRPHPNQPSHQEGVELQRSKVRLDCIEIEGEKRVCLACLTGRIKKEILI